MSDSEVCCSDPEVCCSLLRHLDALQVACDPSIMKQGGNSGERWAGRCWPAAA